jgi:hypothetical protein
MARAEPCVGQEALEAVHKPLKFRDCVIKLTSRPINVAIHERAIAVIKLIAKDTAKRFANRIFVHDIPPI